ncbi:MAG: hypothetical protein NTX12_03680 [Actinobacteria bacterium]|nr:hypothetical protein [Actinomycetota bacterium]
MESLAALVAFLFITALLSGPIALALTYKVIRTQKGRLVRRSFITMFALWGTLNGVQFALSNIPAFARLIGLMSIITSGFAFKREFVGNKSTTSPDEDVDED